MDIEEKVREHSISIEEIKKDIAVLQEDQRHLREWVSDLKSDIKQDIREVNNDLKGDIGTLRDDIQQAMARAAASWPMWASAAVALLGVIIAGIGIFHP